MSTKARIVRPNATTFLNGVDVSRYQGKIDWPKVKASGVSFAFIKASEGITIKDPNYATNIAGALDEGIACAAYHFFHPGDDVSEQITNFLDSVNGNWGTLIPALDVEVPEEWTSIAMATRVQIVQDSLQSIQNAIGGRDPLLYIDLSMFNDTLGAPASLAHYPLWLAEYTTATKPTLPRGFQTWAFWQHTDTGTVPGISGNCDLNYFNGGKAGLAGFEMAAAA